MSQPPHVCASTSELVAWMLGDGHEVQIRLRGSSMKPLLRSGITLRFSARSEPLVGDIALLRHANGTLVAHRIVALGDDWVQTKGDSCLTFDPRLPRSCLLGLAVSLRSLVNVPLRNPLARALGLVTNRAYPRLALIYRTLLPRRNLARC